MDMHQLLAIAIIAVMMLTFIWGRFRYDIVACGALLVALALGTVKPEEAFTGFADDIVIIVGSALVVSGAVAKSGVMEAAVQRLAPNVTSPRMQLLLLVGVVTVLSAFVKNIGALAIMIPIAFQMARRSGVSPSMFLMPMSFGSLLGGLMTLIGTSPNIIVSRVRADLIGTPFRMFDFTPVALPLAITGIVFLTCFYWLLPKRQREDLSLDEAIEIDNYTTEARVTEESSVAEKTVADLHKLAGGDAMVTAILRQGRRRTPLPDAVLRPGDILLLEGGQEALDKLVAQGKLKLAGRQVDSEEPAEEIGAVEAIIGQNSSLVGLSAQQLSLFHRTGLNLLAVSRRDKRFTERLRQIRLEAGDIIVLQGNLKRLPDLLREFDCLPLADRQVRLGSVRNGIVPITILVLAMAATALGLVPVAVAFFAAAVAMVLFGSVTLREVYGLLDAPILIMLAALIPVSNSLQTSGATGVLGSWLATIAANLPPYGALALIMVAAMAVTPFLNNAATVLVMAPIAVSFAGDLGLKPEAFLMAVAIGAGCDFLTPIGHQCNTLVMGPGGYKFSDYSRLGAPLSVLVVLVSVPLLLMVWPVA